jgi:hypothetical protein
MSEHEHKHEVRIHVETRKVEPGFWQKVKKWWQGS